jgi:hypothetical protein
MSGRGPIHRLIALLVAAWLPLCCCRLDELARILQANGGEGGGVPAVAGMCAASCCSSDSTRAPAPARSSNDECDRHCCIKGMTLSFGASLAGLTLAMTVEPVLRLHAIGVAPPRHVLLGAIGPPPTLLALGCGLRL